jgi:hypothetical protein
VKCTEAGPAGERVKVKIKGEPIPIQTDTEHAVGTPMTMELPLIGLFRKGVKELPISGVLDSLGPKPEEGNLVDFPAQSLEATTLTVGGSPAQIVGEAHLTLPRHATLSQAEL